MKKFLGFLFDYIIIYLFCGLVIVFKSRGAEVPYLSPLINRPVEVLANSVIRLVQSVQGNGHLYARTVFDERINNLGNDIYYINCVKNGSKDFVESVNLRSGCVDWSVEFGQFFSRKFSNRQRFHSWLDTNNNSLFVMAIEQGDMICIDLNTKSLKWKLALEDKQFHHRLISYQDRLFANIRRVVKVNDKEYLDEGYVEVDPLNGKQLCEWFIMDSVSPVLDLGKYKGVKWERSGDNIFENNRIDLWHVNDIKLVEGDSILSGVLTKGDLLLSCRNISAILVLSGDTIRDVIHGNFSFQHDVDFLENGDITVFNNNWNQVNYPGYKRSSCITRIEQRKYGRNEMCMFEKVDFFSATEGQSTRIGDLTCIEVQNSSVLMIINDNEELIYRDQLDNTIDKTRINMLNWGQFVDYGLGSKKS